MRNKKTKKWSGKKIAIVLIPFILVVAFIAYVLFTDNNIFSRGNNSQNAGEKPAQTTSKEPSAQADFTGGDDSKDAGNSSTNRGTGAVDDESGNIAQGTDTSNPITSPSGQISLYAPGRGALVKTGQQISGASTLSSVSYRISDNVSGMVTTGQLSVVGGRFSGTLNINTQASEGQLDIFGTQPDGNEFSNISIPIKFK